MASSSGCLICEDPSTGSNPIIACVACGIKVHKLCYGVEKPIQWKCSPCQSGKSSFAACILCVKKGGATETNNVWQVGSCHLRTLHVRRFVP